jgi:hypothetical protein
LLHQVYYAQREYRKRNGGWARDLKALGLTNLSDPSLEGGIRLETTESLFEASVSVKQPGSAPQRWRIRQDARVWRQ